MKKFLFYTFLFLFIATGIITLLGIINLVQIDDKYLGKLFTALIIELIGGVVSLFNKTIFFGDSTAKITPSEVFKLNSSKFGFTINKHKTEYQLNLDGTATETTIREIEVTKHSLSYFTEDVKVDGDCDISNTEIILNGKSDYSTVSYSKFRKSSHSLALNINFSPALSENQHAEYSKTFNYQNGVFLMTHEQVSQQISKKQWPLSEPFEFTGASIKYPTKKLILSISFPKDYKISGNEYFDVYKGDLFERSIDEYKRINEKRFFSYIDSQNGKSLKLEIDYPELGMKYILKWMPPSELELNNNVAQQMV